LNRSAFIIEISPYKKTKYIAYYVGVSDEVKIHHHSYYCII